MNTKYLNLEKIFYVFFLILPICFLSGPFLADLFLSLIGIFFLAIIINKKIFKKYFINRYSLIFLIFYFILILSSFLSDSVLLSLESSLFYFRFLFFSLGISYILINYKNSLKYFCIIFLSVYLFIIFDGFFQYYYGYDLFGFEKPLVDRLSGPFDDELILGGVLSRFFPFAIFCLFYLDTKYKFNFILAFTILTITVLSIVLHSGERTAFFLLIISIIIMLFTLKKIKFLHLSIILISVLIFIGSLLTFNTNIKNRIIDKTYNQIYMFDQTLNAGKICANDPSECKRSLTMFSINHHGHYLTGLKMFYENPVFGHGTKIFRLKCNYEVFQTYAGCSTHPHNMYIQLAAETGIAGLIIPVLLFLIISYQLLKSFFLKIFNKISFQNDMELCLIISFFLTLFPIAPSGNIFNNYTSFIYFLPLGFYIYLNLDKHDDTNV